MVVTTGNREYMLRLIQRFALPISSNDEHLYREWQDVYQASNI